MFNRAFFVDLAERVGASFVEAFAAALLASVLLTGLSLSAAKAAAVAGIAAVLTVVKGAFAGFAEKSSLSPASLVKAPGVKPPKTTDSNGAFIPDAGYSILGLIGAVLCAVGAVLLIIGALHGFLSVLGLVLVVVGVICVAVRDRW